MYFKIRLFIDSTDYVLLLYYKESCEDYKKT